MNFFPILQTRQYNASATVQANTYPLVGRAVGYSNYDSSESVNLAVIVKRPMALTGRNGSLEMMLHRRLVKASDKRGDDSTVLNDSVLVGFLGK